MLAAALALIAATGATFVVAAFHVEGRGYRVAFWTLGAIYLLTPFALV